MRIRDRGPKKTVLTVVLFVTFQVLPLLTLSGCSEGPSRAEEGFKKETLQEIVQLTPKKPTRIVLKRTSKGRYSWELRGEDVEEILRIDGRLRDYMKARGAADNR